MGFLAFLWLLAALPGVSAIAFPNNVTGEPSIECNQDSIKITVETYTGEAPSKIFAKGQSGREECSFSGVKEASFSLSNCNMERARRLSPRGLSYGLVVVVQMHPLFITKVDRAYSVKCFYMEADKVVTQTLDVSMITTDVLTVQHAMPQCMYGLHSESANGPMIRYAKVGDKVWHVWECPSDVYGMLIHSCYVADGQGNQQQILDENGCGIDSILMQTPIYSTDLTRAQQETHVFKFADRINVRFNCQIKLCAKTGGDCDAITPPRCQGTTLQRGRIIQTTQEVYQFSTDVVTSTETAAEAATTGQPLADGTGSAVTAAETSAAQTDSTLVDELTAESLLPVNTTEAATEETTAQTTTEAEETTILPLDEQDATTLSVDETVGETGSGEGAEETTAASDASTNATNETDSAATTSADITGSLSRDEPLIRRRAVLSGSREDPIRALLHRQDDEVNGGNLEMDINQEMFVLDTVEKDPIPENLRTRNERPNLRAVESDFLAKDLLCISTLGFTALMAALALMVIVCCSALFALCIKSRKTRRRNIVSAVSLGSGGSSGSTLSSSSSSSAALAAPHQHRSHSRPSLADHYRYRLGMYKI